MWYNIRMKKTVIAYLHTHWDREWYREFEVFRLRLLRVFDNVLELLESNKIPSFYFDGQTSALTDYLEIRPEKETLVRRLIAEKKLFIGPFYCLVDEFLTDRTCFEKNLEIGLKTARDFGCTDFIGYLADTFGHSKNVPAILQEFGIDKCIVWRGCPAEVPAEFTFNGINTVNLIQGYFHDNLSNIKSTLDKIAQKSSDVLLLPIGADHLGVAPDIAEQIENLKLDDYEIKLSNPFEYFELVKDNFKQFTWNDELRSNDTTFILSGSYSARANLKQYNVECTHRLAMAIRHCEHSADKTIEYRFGEDEAISYYKNIIEYAYKLLLQNQAHDGICGCSTDLVHRENIVRYEKVLQIANTIINSVTLNSFQGLTAEFESSEIDPNAQVIATRKGFDSKLLNDIYRIPVTEDYTDIYTQIKELSTNSEALPPLTFPLSFAPENFIEFVHWHDDGDTYNYGPRKGDKEVKAQIQGIETTMTGPFRSGITIHTDFFDVQAYINKNSKLINFKISFVNEYENRLWQVKFNLPEPVETTFSEDMNTLIERHFDPDYDMRANLPEKPGLELKTNFAPMQRFVWTQGFGVITKGLAEYEVKGNSLCITLLRSVGIISNPHNPARTTPAGPPIPVPDAQQLGPVSAEFSIGFFDKEDYLRYIEEVFPQ